MEVHRHGCCTPPASSQYSHPRRAGSSVARAGTGSGTHRTAPRAPPPPGRGPSSGAVVEHDGRVELLPSGVVRAHGRRAPASDGRTRPTSRGLGSPADEQPDLARTGEGLQSPAGPARVSPGPEDVYAEGRVERPGDGRKRPPVSRSCPAGWNARVSLSAPRGGLWHSPLSPGRGASSRSNGGGRPRVRGLPRRPGVRPAA